MGKRAFFRKETSERKMKKADIELDMLIKFILGVVVLVVIGGLFYFILSKKGAGMIDTLKNFFRFRI